MLSFARSELVNVVFTTDKSLFICASESIDRLLDVVLAPTTTLLETLRASPEANTDTVP